jgi:hypothetical protein
MIIHVEFGFNQSSFLEKLLFIFPWGPILKLCPVILVVPFDNFYRQVYFVMHTFLVLNRTIGSNLDKAATWVTITLYMSFVPL